MSSTGTVCTSDTADSPVFFPVGVPKLLAMSVLTWGFYELAWFYLNWDTIRDRTGRSFSVAVRALVFPAVFVFPLLGAVRREAVLRGVPALPAPYLLAVVFLALSFSGLLGGWWFLMSFLSALPLALVQRYVNRLHFHLGIDPTPNRRLTPLNIVFLAPGAALLGYVLWPLAIWAVSWLRWAYGARLAT